MDVNCKKKLIGKKVKEARKDMKFTQLQLSVLTGLSRNYISDIEKGRYMPSVDALTKLAVPLNMELNFLTSGDGNTR